MAKLAEVEVGNPAAPALAQGQWVEPEDLLESHALIHGGLAPLRPLPQISPASISRTSGSSLSLTRFLMVSALVRLMPNIPQTSSTGLF